MVHLRCGTIAHVINRRSVTMATVCVFTPTFNRAYILPKLYESLVAQTSRDFS